MNGSAAFELADTINSPKFVQEPSSIISPTALEQFATITEDLKKPKR